MTSWEKEGRSAATCRNVIKQWRLISIQQFRWEFYDPGGTYEGSQAGVTVIREPSDFWRPPGNDRASTMIASMYPNRGTEISS